MRILAIGPMPPKADGLADYTDGVLAAYAAAGHITAVLADAPADRSDPRVVGELSLSPAAFSAALVAILRLRPEVVHVQHAIATYALRLAPLWLLVAVARARGARILVTHHEMTRDLQRLGLLGRLYYRIVSALADIVHVHTDEARRTAIERVGVPAARVVVHPHPVFVQQGGSAGRTLRAKHALVDRLLLLQLGFVQVEKGLLELVEGLGVLVARRPDLPVHLVVAGAVRRRPPGLARYEQADRDYEDAVRRRVEALGIEDLVTWTGHVQDEDLAGWLEAADLVTLPYAAIEQSGIANRAVAAGTPMLATRAGGLGELLSDLPGFTSLDAEAVAMALETAIDDLPEVRRVADALYARLRAEGDPRRLVDILLDGEDRLSEVARA